MKKKALITMGAVAASLILSTYAYVYIGKKSLETQMIAYLKEKSYSEADILSMEIEHSFVNILLAYNEWSVKIEFADEPGVHYFYTKKKNEIIGAGVSGGNINKEDLKHVN